MFILTNNDNEVIHISNTLDIKNDRYIIDGNLGVFKEYKTQLQDGTIEVNKITNYEVEIPEDIEVEKYCYTEKDGFYKNPNYVAPPQPIEEQITDLQLAMAELAELVVGGNE